MNKRPTKMKQYNSFLDWKDDQSKDNLVIINELQKIIHEIAPNLTTIVKWGQGYWADEGAPKIYIHTEDDHVQLGFYNGSSLDDPYGLLTGNGKYIRFIKLSSIKDINRRAISELISRAAS